MIGVIAKNNENNVVEEFFELFKTPWEYYTYGMDYDVVLCSEDLDEQPLSDLTLIYCAEKKQIDSSLNVELFPSSKPGELLWNNVVFPIYTGVSVFESRETAVLSCKSSGKPAAVKINQGEHRTVRIGYDLFREVEFLLTSGQPVEYAHVPTLEVHIAILRNLMIDADVPFVEIPPVPYGYDFITCLTHDIDFAGIRNHRFDHTMFGFLYRSICKTFCNAIKGKVNWRRWWKNLRAVLSLPAVYAGLTPDFWAQFDEYLKIEKGLKATYFFLPFKDVPGKINGGNAPGKRAGRYDVSKLKKYVSHIQSEGCEVGLHGIDAWRDAEKCLRESKQIASVAGRPVYGTRIHWLYFNKNSPTYFEKTGLKYDSTLGYNEAVGFHAGTAQAFRPPETKDFLELPLLVQDTAMFYPERMGLCENEAFVLCKNIIKNVYTFGGVLVINWHDRSLAPERLWGDFYMKLLLEIKSWRPWFATGSEVTEWFQKRRSAKFSKITVEDELPQIAVEGFSVGSGPGLGIKIYGNTRRNGTSYKLEGNTVR